MKKRKTQTKDIKVLDNETIKNIIKNDYKNISLEYENKQEIIFMLNKFNMLTLKLNELYDNNYSINKLKNEAF